MLGSILMGNNKFEIITTYYDHYYNVVHGDGDGDNCEERNNR